MWRKFLLAGVVAVVVAVASLAVSGVAFADTPAVSKSVPMQGQASVVGNPQSPQLRLRLSATDGSNWLLETALDPARTGLSGNIQVLYLSGTFTLGLPQMPLTSGAANATMDQNGNLDVRLTDSAGTTGLDMQFSLRQDGTITGVVQGHWPDIPAPKPSVATAPAAPTGHFFWYLSRMAGIASYLLFFGCICAGLVLRLSTNSQRPPRWLALDLHKFLALLGMGLLVLHVFSLLGDHYFNFSIAQLLVPFQIAYRPVPVAIGVLAFYAALAMMLTFYLRRHVGRRAWKALHAASALFFLAALVHGVTAGTDTSALWAKWMYAATAGVVILAGLTMLTSRRAAGRSGARQLDAHLT